MEINKTSTYTVPVYGASAIIGYSQDYLFNERLIVTGRVGTHGVLQCVYGKSYPTDNTLVIFANEYFNYIYATLMNLNFEKLNVGSTQPLITQSKLLNIPLYNYEKGLILYFCTKIEPLFSQISINNVEIETLSNIKNLLLNRISLKQ